MLKSRKQNSSCIDLIQKKLAEGHVIRPFPQVVSQLLSAINDQNSNSRTFAKIIESDAALSARLLRMANSPIYGFSNVIGTIDHATAMLGTIPLKNLALTFAGTTMFCSKGEGSQPRELLWNHSLGCATIARLLANSVPCVNPDEAFLAGVFHDVGKLFFQDVVPKEYLPIFVSSCGEELIELEKELFETSHEEVGAKLSTAWRLPEQIMVAVGYHHQPENAIAHSELVAVVHLADWLARSGGIGSSEDSRINVSDAAIDLLPMDEETLASVREQAREIYDETKQAYSS